ncbi:cobalamin biosynthesis protein [Roseovarius sp. D22-M7]|uniref:cobalamin biosynthesis protein n=1 Tax=Roseovarius sp. D22-M7 TaxID=3127116 RepID=UPI00300FE1B3
MIAAGFGFRAAATTASLRDALDLARARTGAGPTLVALATAADKAGAAPLCALAQALGLPIHAVDTARLTAQHTPTRSHASQAAHGTGSVAEAAALAAAGPEARIVAPRVISGDGMATCALAEGKDP